MDASLRMCLDAFRQKPSLSYSESLTLEMLQDLEKLQQEGASVEEMQLRILGTTIKLHQHEGDIDRKIERHHLEQQKEHYQTMLGTIRAFQEKIEPMEKSVSSRVLSVLEGHQVANVCQTEESGDEWEKLEEA